MPETTASETLSHVISLIQNTNASLDQIKKEIATNKEMVEDALNNDPTYRSEAEKVKAAAKVRNEVKNRILQQPNLLEINGKLKDQKLHLKELRETLSEYLQEYQRQTGSKTIEGPDGQLNEIVYTARLIKTGNKPQ